MSLTKFFPWREMDLERKKVALFLTALLPLMFAFGLMSEPAKPFIQRCFPFGALFFGITVFTTFLLSRVLPEPFARCAWKMMALVSLGMFAVLAYGCALHFHWF